MDSTQSARGNVTNRDTRSDINAKILNFKSHLESHSERQAAKLADIPRSTARHHAKREEQNGLDEAIVAFFRTLVGMNFLHQLVLAIEFVMSQLGHGSIRLIQRIYELSGLDNLVACSVGTLSNRIKGLEENVIEYGEQQEKQLAATLTNEKVISCCLDETFPAGNTCLVGMEPVSNYILVEQMAERRDAATWIRAMDNRLKNLPVTINQVTSDEAKALIYYTEKHLSAQHSPDLFHIQQEVSKASAAPLKAKLKKAEATVERTTTALNELEAQQIAHDNLGHKPKGRPLDFPRHLAEAEVEKLFAETAHKEAESQRDKVRQSNKTLGEIYHPFELSTGKQRTPNQLSLELVQTFDIIEAQLIAAELSENSLKRIDKARRMVDSMVDTLQFFWTSVNQQVQLLSMKEALKKVFMEKLLPALYWEIHTRKADSIEAREQRMAMAKQLFRQLEENEHWRILPEERKLLLKNSAIDCANIFQRSSSNVEGRNGQLSLYHHSFKSMSARKLKASTVIHNYFCQRSDGTTAAERFFGKAPEPLFKHLLSRTDHPAAPAKKRSKLRILRAVA